MLEHLFHNNKLISIIIRSKFSSKKTNFFTPKDNEFQIGAICYDKNNIAKKHSHKKRNSVIKSTSEVLFIKEGKLRALIYNKSCTKLIYNKILKSGDIIFLNECGHSFKFLKKTIMIEIKQGPYLGINDKIIY